MDVRDSSSSSDLVDFDQSHTLEIIDKITQLAPENVTTKSDSEKSVCSGKISLNDEEGRTSGIQLKTNRSKCLDDHKRNNGGIKSSLEGKDDSTASSEMNYFTSEDRLASVSNFPESETSSRVDKTEPTCTNDEQCPLDMVVHKEVNKSVETVSKVVSNLEDTSDEFSKDLIKAEMEASINGGEEKKLDSVIPDFEVKSPQSDDIVADQVHTSNCSKIEDEIEAPNKQREVDVSASEERMHAKTSLEQKNRKAEVKQKPDSLRPLSRLLHDLGLDLVREQVYKDLIGIQVAKDVKNMLDDKEKEQLKRLTDAHSKLIVKNAVYQLPFVSCRCSYSSSSANVLALHHEFGSTYEVPFHTCCLCEDCKTRWPSQFLSHLESLHQIKGRVQTKLAPNICRYCPYEHKNQARMEVHSGKCFKKFNLNTNLQPVPADCDIPLMGKPTSQLLRPGMMPYPSGLSNFSISHGVQQLAKPAVGIGTAAASNIQPSVMEIGGQLYSLVHHNGKALFTSLRSQIANVNVSSHNSNTPSSAVVPANFPRFVQPLNKPSAGERTSDTPTRVPFVEKCEMCDAVLKDRDALWNHFRLLHKVELSRVSMIEKEPWMTCDVCLAKFWTYQGLTRHSVQLHKRELNSQGLPTKTFKCFLCLQTHANPLNHLSTFHNITLLDMYHSRRCCMCNKRFRSAPSFEEHMVLQHHDIFANKDVLCTVLQALSTALSLKRQEAMQHKAPNTASFSKVNPRGGTNFGPGFSGNLQNTISPAATSFQKNSPGANTPGKVPTLSKVPTPNKVVSPNVAPTASTGQPEAKKRVKQSNEQSKGNDSGNTSKTSPKKSNEEDTKELNKLYKEYADIGRPILRSMRHRLSRNSLEKVVGDGQKDSMENKEDKRDVGLSKSPEALNEDNKTSVAETNLSDEPLRKRLCTEGSNNDKLNNYFDANQQKQLQEINGDLPT